jgi:hypothetical protein
VPAESTEKVFQEVSASFIKLNNLLKLLIFYLMSFQPGRDPIEERGRLSLEARHRDTSLRSITIEAFEARKAELKGDGKSQRAPWQKPPPGSTHRLDLLAGSASILQFVAGFDGDPSCASPPDFDRGAIIATEDDAD